MAKRPVIVCLCGSARFTEPFEKRYLEETPAGRIVLSIATVAGGDDKLFGGNSSAKRAQVTDRLAELHRHKIDRADEILILNVGGYIGSSTARERAYAEMQGKQVRLLEDEHF